MPIVVKAPGARQNEFTNAEDIDVDDTGTLLLTRGSGRTEETVAAFAPGAWISAEKK